MHCSSLFRLLAALLLLALVAGCASSRTHDAASRERHIVRTGETLYTIAWRYGKDHKNLARWNNLGDGSLIYPGQVIRLHPPASGAAAPPRSRPRPEPLPPIPSDPSPSWAWPVDGKVDAEFGQRPRSGTGILVTARNGAPVRAAADGRVVYAGGGLIGYGQLIIVKHNDTYLSAYGHNASLLVREGETIRKGQRIATLGEGPGQKPRLHFEIRRNGKPVNPRQYLPAR